MPSFIPFGLIFIRLPQKNWQVAQAPTSFTVPNSS